MIGANSIAAYMMAHLFDDFIKHSFRIHFGRHVFEVFGKPYQPLFTGAVVLGVYWLILFWMYRRRIFLRV